MTVFPNQHVIGWTLCVHGSGGPTADSAAFTSPATPWRPQLFFWGRNLPVWVHCHDVHLTCCCNTIGLAASCLAWGWTTWMDQTGCEGPDQEQLLDLDLQTKHTSGSKQPSISIRLLDWLIHQHLLTCYLSTPVTCQYWQTNRAVDIVLPQTKTQTYQLLLY